MAAGHAQRLKLRLFLEGVEVPVISAQVSASPNGPSVAGIQIPPLAEATRLHPRTLVHLYFLDMYTATSPFIDASNVSNSDKEDPTASDKEQSGTVPPDTSDASYQNEVADALNRDYRLLFVGEIVGFQWTKTALHRSVVLQCLDLSNYWDYAYQHNNTGLFGPGFKAVFSGGATNLFTDFLTTKGSVLTAVVTSGKCNTFPQLKGLAAGIVRLIEAIGGTYFPRPGTSARRVRGQNLFFSMAELRLHITQMVGALENDTTSKNIISRQGYSGMFDRALGGLGRQTSIRDAINAMTKVVFHETYPQPCPLYVPGSAGEVSGTRQVKLKGHPMWGFIADGAEKGLASLAAAKTSLDTLTEEVEFLQTVGGGYRPIVLKVRDRLVILRKELYRTMVKIRGSARNPPPDQAHALYAKAAYLTGIAAGHVSVWRPKAPDSIRERPYNSIDKAIEQLQKVLDLTTSELPTSEIQPARLIQQILRPDIWFGAPPRCNVIFPEAYSDLQYQRAFLQEPTRFLLKTNDEFFGEDALFDRYYFAPQAGSVKSNNTQMQDMLRGAILDHELYTGILPVFEKMGEFNIFANRSGTQQSVGNVPKAGPAQRSANFLYFKHRFNARRLTISGKFNPWVAPGFPGLVIDKYVDAETIKLHNQLKLNAKELGLTEKDVGSVLGTNFLGNFTQVTHMVSQQETRGSTEIVCSYPRQPEEGVDFLGTADELQKVKKKESEDGVRSTIIAALNPPKLFGLGPNYGRIINVVDVTEATRRKDLKALGQEGLVPVVNAEADNTSVKLPLFDLQTSPKRRGQKPTLVDVSIFPKEAREFGAEVEEITGDPERLVRFKAYRVTEEVPRYRQEDAYTPFEEFIRPGWYGDVWSTAKIGQAYNELLGIGSITDTQTIVGPNGAALNQASEAQQAAEDERSRAEDSTDPRRDAPAALALDEGATVQAAVEFLWLTYSYIKQQDLDVEEFIRAYTWRPVATMLDLFGTNDLVYTENGEKVLSGKEGFHSKAFGPYDNLFGLVGPQVEDILGIKRGEQASQRADTRKEKLKKVQEYVAALRFNRAILG